MVQFASYLMAELLRRIKEMSSSSKLMEAKRKIQRLYLKAFTAVGYQMSCTG